MAGSERLRRVQRSPRRGRSVRSRPGMLRPRVSSRRSRWDKQHRDGEGHPEGGVDRPVERVYEDIYRFGGHPDGGRASARSPGGSAPLSLVCWRTVPLRWPREPRDPELRGESYGRDTDTAALAERCPCFRQAAAAAGEAAGRPAARRRAPAGRTQRKTGGRPGSRAGGRWEAACGCAGAGRAGGEGPGRPAGDRKSTRLNSSHITISYAVFCLKKKKTNTTQKLNVEWY